MELLTQPEGSYTCGHHCVAMLSGKPIDDIIKLIGHTRGTYTRELISALNKLDIQPIHRRMVRMNKHSDIQSGVYILSVKWSNKHYHWILISNGFIYDPGSWHSGIYTYSEYLEFLDNNGKITSYLKVY